MHFLLSIICFANKITSIVFLLVYLVCDFSKNDFNYISIAMLVIVLFATFFILVAKKLNSNVSTTFICVFSTVFATLVVNQNKQTVQLMCSFCAIFNVDLMTVECKSGNGWNGAFKFMIVLETTTWMCIVTVCHDETCKKYKLVVFFHKIWEHDKLPTFMKTFSTYLLDNTIDLQ